MSYILDAIKKADQKRKLGSVPDIHSVHGPDFPDGRQVRWPYWAAAVALLLINGGGLVWWLGYSAKRSASSDIPEIASTIEPDAHSSPQSETDNAPAVLGGNAGGIRALSAKTDEVAATISGDQDTGAGRDSSLQVSPPAMVSGNKLPAEMNEALPEEAPLGAVVAEPATEELLSGADDSSAGEGVDEELDEEPLDSADQEPIILGSLARNGPEVSSSEDDLVEEYKDAQERESDEEALKKIPYYYQLPDSAQQTLPEFHISFHAYSRRPSARIVSVNGKVLREGQDFDNKIKLEQITPSGIVLLSAGTWRFKVDVD